MYSYLVQRAIWQHHISSLASYNFETKLIGQSSPSQLVSKTLNKPNCRTSSKIQHLGKTFSANDVVLGARPGIIMSSEQADKDFYVILQPLQLEEHTDFWSRWKLHGNKALVPISELGTRPTWWLKLDETCWLCLHWKKTKSCHSQDVNSRILLVMLKPQRLIEPLLTILYQMVVLKPQRLIEPLLTNRIKRKTIYWLVPKVVSRAVHGTAISIQFKPFLANFGGKNKMCCFWNCLKRCPKHDASWSTKNLENL